LWDHGQTYKFQGSKQAHLPFAWTAAHDGSLGVLDADELASKTIEYAQLIGSRYKNLDDMDISTAEATAKMINANKLLPALLEMFLNPGPKRVESSLKDGSEQLRTVKTGSKTLPSKVPASKRRKLRLLDAEESIASTDINRTSDIEIDASTKNTNESWKGRRGFAENHWWGIVEPFHTASNKVKRTRSSNDVSQLSGIPKDENLITQTSKSTALAMTKFKKKSKAKNKRSKTVMNSQGVLNTTVNRPVNISSVQELQGIILDKSECADNESNAVRTEDTPFAEAIVQESTPELKPFSPESMMKDEVATSESALSEEMKSTEPASVARSTTQGPDETLPFPTQDSCAVPLRSPIMRPSVPCSLGQETREEQLAPSEEPLPAIHQPSLALIPRIEITSPMRAMDNGSHLTVCETAIMSCAPDHDDNPEKVPAAEQLTIESGNVPDSSHLDSKGILDIPAGGIQNPRWAYATNTEKDDKMIADGIWLWPKPPTYYYPHPVHRKISDGHTMAPVVVSHERTGMRIPMIEYDGEVVYIVPHSEPWEDFRTVESHPDFIPPRRLVEYQACEAAGHYVWRHDRDALRCRKPDCGALVMDFGPSTVLCQGCGPKTVVRYCCFQHQIDDIGDHWPECGNRRLVLEYVADHNSEPPWFSDQPPGIIEQNGTYGIKSAALQRQKIYSMRNGGHYTLFNPKTQAAKTLGWPKVHPHWQELDRRIERLLNIAFFNVRKHEIIRYLYSLLREILRLSGEWNSDTEELLKTQIRDEFDPYHRKNNDPADVRADAPCECEWSGTRPLPLGHAASCRGGATIEDGRQSPAPDLQTTVEQMENMFWILRAWRQQHPTEKDWRVRANGYNILPLEPGENVFTLGPGWSGWGGMESNIRGPDWEMAQRIREYLSGY